MKYICDSVYNNLTYIYILLFLFFSFISSPPTFGLPLPTPHSPAKFHYVFNLRDLSRIFAGVLMTPKNTIINGGTMKDGQDGSQTLLGLWRHECERVFCDKLTNQKDKNWYIEFMKRHLESHFPAIADAIMEDDELFFVDFLKDDVYDEDGILSLVAPKIYEDGGPLESIRLRVEMYMQRYNVRE